MSKEAKREIEKMTKSRNCQSNIPDTKSDIYSGYIGYISDTKSDKIKVRVQTCIRPLAGCDLYVTLYIEITLCAFICIYAYEYMYIHLHI